LSTTTISPRLRAASAIADLEHGVGRGFDPDHPGVRADGGFERGDVGQVDETEIQAGAALAHALEQAIAAAVDIIHRDDVVAAVQQFQHGRGGRHAGSKGETATATL
jgi:hypothetical protein